MSVIMNSLNSIVPSLYNVPPTAENPLHFTVYPGSINTCDAAAPISSDVSRSALIYRLTGPSMTILLIVFTVSSAKSSEEIL